MPPLPPATMVIDMRGQGEDIISMLAAEIRHLAQEMERQNILSWRSLADIISFIALDPVEVEEGGYAARMTGEDSSLADSSLADLFTALPEEEPIIIDTPDTSLFEPILENAPWIQSHISGASRHMEDEEPPEVELPPAFVALPEKIDLLRNARIKARADSVKIGSTAYRWSEEVVRVIFLADASNYNSLSSAASCAMYLKDYYRKFERNSPGIPAQSSINTCVLCLNHEGTDQDSGPEELIEGLAGEDGWDHLDALILIEKYQQNMALLDTETQNLFAEQLLYVLLTVSPALSKNLAAPQTPAEFEDLLTLPGQQQISLPTNTFLVGLSSIEHSTRWGYRLLNYGLTEQALQVLREDNATNRQNENQLANHWLTDLRNRVRKTLSAALPAHIPDLRALSRSLETASPERGVFSHGQRGPRIGEKSVAELEKYLNRVVTTYRDGTDRRFPRPDARPSPPTLEDAALCAPRIRDMLDQWDEENSSMPLAEAQIMAYRVLAHENLFHGPRGAIPAAKRQLKALAEAIMIYENGRQQDPVDVEARQKELQQLGQDRIDDLKKHVGRWPLLAGVFRLKWLLALLANGLLLLLSFILAVFSLAWIEEFVASLFPSVSQFLNLPLFGFAALTWFHIIFVLVLFLLAACAIAFFGRALLQETRSAFLIEIIFALILGAVAFLGLITRLSYQSVTAPDAQAIILWYPTNLLQIISTIAFLLVIVIMLVENVFYFSWWERTVRRKRAAAAEAIRGKHHNTIEEIATSIVDTLTLYLLRRAGLVPPTTKGAANSPYYERIEALDRLLITTLSYVEDERRLADSRLSYEASEISPYTREELLDVAGLKNGYWRWRKAMDNTLNEFRELSVILLRTMGEEKPGAIERQLREDILSSNIELRYVQILTGMLTAVALCMSTTIPSAHLLTSLQERYGELDTHVIDQYSAPGLLIDIMSKKIRTSSLARELDTHLAAQALAAWGQMIWEKQDPELRKLLIPGNVMSRLLEEKRDPHMVIDELRMRASPSGRSVISGLHGSLYLFVSPSPESHAFLKNITPTSTAFPDPERLLMLYTQYFRARPLIR